MADQKNIESGETQFPGLKDDSAPDLAAQPDAAVEASNVPRGDDAEDISVDEMKSIVVPNRRIKAQTRRDFLLYGAGVVAAAAGFWYVLPPDTQMRLDDKKSASSPRKERFLNRALDFDDDVAAALYLPNRLVPTFDKSRALSPSALINNYNGQTPDPSYLATWTLTVQGLASGRVEKLSIGDIDRLMARYARRDQVTRLVCVEGWSAIAWWGGLRFADFLQAFPPMPGAKWARLDSEYNLDGDGNPDPYFVSIDLPTARHPQTLLATHQSGKRLTVDHGAPLRLIAPMKLGLKNIKAISKVTYCMEEPPDYWNQYGYSRYDGV